ncbi:hypothetical protein D1871_10825 [Nakamurella silvestris]|nr:hypothetical protein D1871_10825 [Nakamurella silvestris]
MVPSPDRKVTSSDPFDTAGLRRTVLDGWKASPARFREDANAEESLTLTGYANRVVVELAANAADAALLAGVPGRLRLRVVDGELRAANNGAGLTAAGVAALASLRASAKRDDAGGVGHFGVGFTAVLAVTDSPRIISRTGSVVFGADRTARAVEELGSAELDAEVAAREGHVPILRLVWPATDAEEVPAGYTTEIRLPLIAGVDGRAVLAAVGDHLLLALPGLTEIDTPEGLLTRVEEAGTSTGDGPTTPQGDDSSTVDTPSPADDLPQGRYVRITGPEGSRRWYLVARSGMADPALLAGRPVEERRRPGWQLTWAHPDGDALGQDVIYAPTPTDEALDLPARLIGSFPVDDTRRRLAAGPLTELLLAEAVLGYLDLVGATPPDERLALVPAAGFGLGELDARLRSDILGKLGRHPFLTTAVGAPIAPARALTLPGAGPRLCELVGRAIPELVATPPTRAGVAALRALGAGSLALHEVSRALGGLALEPTYWSDVYTELAELGHGSAVAEELADLPVPLADGRTVLGARGCLIADWADSDSDLIARLVRIVPGLRMVHPEFAADPRVRGLLVRLGAVPAGLDGVLAGDALAAEIADLRRDLDDGEAEVDRVTELGGVILDLMVAGARLPESLREQLVLTDEESEPWPANQLLLPGAPLASVLAGDADLPAVEAIWSDRYPVEVLAEAGVLQGFRIVHDAAAVGPDHDLPDEDEWWENERQLPWDFWAVADLDLVDEGRWPQALEILAAQPDSARWAADGSYTRWWLARYATLGGRAPRDWRDQGAVELAGLYDELPEPVPRASATLAGVRTGIAEVIADDLAGLLQRFADPARSVAPGRVRGLTDLIATALSTAHADLPDRMRTLAGTVAPADEVLVVDEPWFAQVVPLDRAVAGALPGQQLAEAFDLALASTDGEFELRTGGSTAELDPADARVRAVSAALGPSSLGRTVWQAESLSVTTGVPVSASREPGAGSDAVIWWCAAGQLWFDGSTEGLARCLAYSAGRWEDRALVLAVLRDRWWEWAE